MSIGFPGSSTLRKVSQAPKQLSPDPMLTGNGLGHAQNTGDILDSKQKHMPLPAEN